MFHAIPLLLGHALQSSSSDENSEEDKGSGRVTSVLGTPIWGSLTEGIRRIQSPSGACLGLLSGIGFRFGISGWSWGLSSMKDMKLHRKLLQRLLQKITLSNTFKKFAHLRQAIILTGSVTALPKYCNC